MNENEIKIKLLKTNIERFDQYISTTNVKASIILAFNSIIIGSIFLKYNVFIRLYENPTWGLYISLILIILLGISSTLSIIFAFRVINPFLESGHEDSYQSLLFFKSIAEMKKDTYKEMIKNTNFGSYLEDLEKQSYQLAVGMTRKSMDTIRSITFIYIGLGIIIILFILKGIISFVII